MKQLIFTLTLLVTLCTLTSFAQSDSLNNKLEIGIRAQKFTGFYWENGMSVEYKPSTFLKSRLSFGANVRSSIFGTAMIYNAIPTLAIEFSTLYYWRKKGDFQPFARLNVGVAKAFYSSTYANLTDRAPLVSTEFGFSYQLSTKFRTTSTFGINAISGNGTKGLGTVYPVYGQVSLFYTLKR
jgi:hypothetical protein